MRAVFVFFPSIFSSFLHLHTMSREIWFQLFKAAMAGIGLGFGLGYGVTMARRVIAQGEANTARRFGSVIRLRPGTEGKYKDLHAAVWPKVCWIL